MNISVKYFLNTIYDASLLSVVDQKMFLQKSNQLAKDTYLNKILHTCKLVSITYVIKSTCFIAFRFFQEQSSTPQKFGIVKPWNINMSFTAIVILPLFEEIIFRLIGLNTIKCIQCAVFRILSNNHLEHPIFSWLSSSSARVVIVGFVFGATHIAFGQIIALESITRVAILILFPTETIIYEATNSFSASLVAHILNNAYGVVTEVALRSLF